jgi:hypothetical protein
VTFKQADLGVVTFLNTNGITFNSPVGRPRRSSRPSTIALYHVEAGSREPVGGISRFQTLCNQYQEGSPKLLTLFSGDAFNPSLESSVTKGSPGDLHNGMIQADVMKVHIWCHF